MRIEGSQIVLTGASRGLGATLARALAARGARLVLVARTEAALAGLRAELGEADIALVGADVATAEGRRAIVAAAEARGPIDALINNAGLFVAGELEDLAPETVSQVLAVNLEAPIALTALVLPGMIARKRGRIVNIASLGGLLPIGWGEVYAASKHGLVGFTRSLQIRLSEESTGVHASAVCPGFIGDVGMYTDHVDERVVQPRWLLRPCRSEDVVTAVIAALEGGTLERVVNSTPVGPLVVLNAASAALGSRLTRWLGLHELIRRTFTARP